MIEFPANNFFWFGPEMLIESKEKKIQTDLNTDLLVLIACESGLGKVVKGEGIYALTRGFLYAGADNIVVSLWQVADKSTSLLMLNFYKNILEGIDYPSALRETKLEMIKGGQYAYPFEWSPFVLFGR